MKIGVWLGNYDNPQVGGGYPYIDRLIKAIDGYTFSPQLEICFVTEGACGLKTKKKVIELKYEVQQSAKGKILSTIPVPCLSKKYKQRLEKRMNFERPGVYTKILRQNDIKIIYYIRQWQCELPDFPYVINNWDVGHCSTYAFPEVASGWNLDSRYGIYKTIYQKALFIFAESEAGRKELIQYSNINPQRIKVVPIFAGECVKDIMSENGEKSFLKSKSLLKNRYFFYPAQFWAHKNHIGLINSFKSFLSFYPGYKLVLTGSDKGTLEYVRMTVYSLGLQDSVLFLGFVSTEEMNALYRNATSLIMASYMGPTNMPPLEAMELYCPVICSDLAGHREELGEAALYFNPLISEELTDAMKKMVKERESYLERIRKQVKETRFTLENALQAIDKNLCEAAIVRNCWG